MWDDFVEDLGRLGDMLVEILKKHWKFAVTQLVAFAVGMAVGECCMETEMEAKTAQEVTHEMDRV